MRKLLLTFVVLTVSGGVYAQDADLVFNALDADRNNAVSLEDAHENELVALHFADADTNADGELSRDEFVAAFGSE